MWQAVEIAELGNHEIVQTSGLRKRFFHRKDIQLCDVGV